jgi:hypothetical protein
MFNFINRLHNRRQVYGLGTGAIRQDFLIAFSFINRLYNRPQVHGVRTGASRQGIPQSRDLVGYLRYFPFVWDALANGHNSVGKLVHPLRNRCGVWDGLG